MWNFYIHDYAFGHLQQTANPCRIKSFVNTGRSALRIVPYHPAQVISVNWSRIYGWRRGFELHPGQGVGLEAKPQRGRGADSTKCAANSLCWVWQGGVFFLLCSVFHVIVIIIIYGSFPYFTSIFVLGWGRSQPVVPLGEVRQQAGLWYRSEKEWCELAKWQRYRVREESNNIHFMTFSRRESFAYRLFFLWF